MKTPRFWSTRNLLSTLLLPISGCYFLGYCWRQKKTRPVTLPVPVLCIGNLTTGGAGKTPVALAMAELLKQKNINAFFISRGYGGRAKGPLRVDPARHSALDVGDEPLLLARALPTIVGKDRLRAAHMAIAHGAEMIVMDDGFQNPTLVKTLSFIVIDRRLSFGNERLLPAGPLREPVATGLARAHAIVIINPATFLPTALPHIPFILARSYPHDDVHALKGKKIIAFCGIAYPQKFYDMLQSAGVELVDTVSFGDHHRFSKKELEMLRARAQLQGAMLVTTAKDATRLPDAFKAEVTVAEMRLAFENPEQLHQLIESARHAN